MNKDEITRVLKTPKPIPIEELRSVGLSACHLIEDQERLIKSLRWDIKQLEKEAEELKAEVKKLNYNLSFGKAATREYFKTHGSEQC